MDYITRKLYTESDLGVLLSSSGCNSFDSCIAYLEHHAEELRALTREQVEQLLHDLRELKRLGVPFSSEPGLLYVELERVK